jgi:hypothetical protein
MDFPAYGADHVLSHCRVGTEMKIAIIAALLEKRDMNIQSGQFFLFSYDLNIAVNDEPSPGFS